MDFIRRARSQPERTRREDRRLKFYGLRDNLQKGCMRGRGLTNRQIAQDLFVTEKTIEWHLGQAYRKLAIRSRSELPRALGA